MGLYSGKGGKPRTQIRWDGQFVSFHALTRYWITSGRGIKANAALGIKYDSGMRSKLPTETRAGLLVVHVENDGPAEKAGVLLGDVLFEVGGETVEHVDAIQDSLAKARCAPHPITSV
jgi:S1-C subfamily serine protease